MNPLTKATRLLLKSTRPLLLCHPRPDGDTIGSALALRLALLTLGKEPLVACADPVPESFRFLTGADTLVQTLPPDWKPDLVVAVDQSNLERTGGLYRPEWRGVVPLLVIDHHKTNDNFGDVNLIEPEAVATATVMFKVIAALRMEVRGAVATALLTGLLTDTRGLRTANVTPEVIELVAQLTRAGGDYQTVTAQALDSKPYAVLRLHGVALSRLQLKDGIAWTTVPLEEKLRLGIEDYEDLELGNLLAQTGGAQLMAAFIEMRDGNIKVSLRARQGYDLTPIAVYYRGGGHPQAAGVTLPGPLEAAAQEIVARLRALKETAHGRSAAGR